MSFGVIYSYPNNVRASKALVAAKLNNLDVTYAEGFQMGVTNTTDEFKRKFVTGKIPVFEGADGLTLFDSDAISQYLADSGPASAQLLGATPADRATIRQWIAYSGSDVFPDLISLCLPRFGLAKYSAADDEAKLPRLHRALATIDAHLKDRTYLATEKAYSLADLSVVTTLWPGFGFLFGAEDRAKYPNVIRWFKLVTGDELVKSVYGEPQYTDKIVIPK